MITDGGCWITRAVSKVVLNRADGGAFAVSPLCSVHSPLQPVARSVLLFSFGLAHRLQFSLLLSVVSFLASIKSGACIILKASHKSTSWASGVVLCEVEYIHRSIHPSTSTPHPLSPVSPSLPPSTPSSLQGQRHERASVGSRLCARLSARLRARLCACIFCAPALRPRFYKRFSEGLVEQ